MSSDLCRIDIRCLGCQRQAFVYERGKQSKLQIHCYGHTSKSQNFNFVPYVKAKLSVTYVDDCRYAIGYAERSGPKANIGWLSSLANATDQPYQANNTGGPTLKVKTFAAFLRDPGPITSQLTAGSQDTQFSPFYYAHSVLSSPTSIVGRTPIHQQIPLLGVPTVAEISLPVGVVLNARHAASPRTHHFNLLNHERPTLCCPF